jgi:hypothetical protein
MGVSIHYRGKLDNKDRLPALRNALSGIASSLGWQCRVLDEDWNTPANAILAHRGKTAEIEGHLGLKGIQLSPPGKSESLDFFFDSEGNLLSPMSIVLIQEGVLALDDAWISLKTQFLSPELHVFIIGLLKYIKEQYIPNLEVRDEGEYWETEDYQNLVKKMEVIDKKLDYLSRELFSDCLVDPGSLSVDEIAARIEFLLHAEELKSRSIN